MNPPDDPPTDKSRRKRIEALLYPWIERLGFGADWSIAYGLTSRRGKATKGVFARININHPYRRAVIEYVRESLDAATDEELTDSTVHELAHLLLEPVTQLITEYLGDAHVATELMQATETACDQVALRLLVAYWGKPRGGYFDPYAGGNAPVIKEPTSGAS